MRILQRKDYKCLYRQSNVLVIVIIKYDILIDSFMHAMILTI